MFIHSLTLFDFKSHRHTAFQFGKVNLIRGANNVGKSSVAAALEFLLTGRCEATDDAGRGGEALIRLGAKKAVLEAEIGVNRELRVVRERSASGTNCVGSFAGRQYAGRQFTELMAKKGWNLDVMSAAMRGGRFLSLSPAEQKELLADVLAPESVKVPKEIQEACDDCFAGFVFEDVELEGARQVETMAIKLRAECTAALRELGEPEPVEERPKDAPTAEETEQKLNRWRGEMMGLVRQKERLENEWAERANRRRELPAQIAALEKKILPEAEEKKCLEAIEHEGEPNRAVEELRRVNIQIEEYEHQIKGANKAAGKCPTCGHEADTEELTARIGKSIESLRSRIPNLDSQANRFGNAPAAREVLREHRESLVRCEKLKGELATFGDPKTDVLPDTKGLQTQIDELEKRIEKGQTVLAGIAAHEERVAAWRNLSDERALLEQKRGSADTLAKWCGPSGVQAQMSSGKIGPFTEALNSVLTRFGYQAQITLDPYSIQVARPDSPFLVDLAGLSESEQWRFSLGFQVALAKATGLNLVVLDRADVLVGENRGKLVATVLECGLDQVFLMASVDKKAQLPDSFTVWDLSLNEKGETIGEKSPSS